MDFYFTTRKDMQFTAIHEYVNDLSSIELKTGVLYIEKLKHLDYLFIDNARKTWYLGDVVKHDSFDETLNKGFFYTIHYDSELHCLELCSDYHSFLPIYYSEDGNELVVSSSVDLIVRNLKKKTCNPDFISDIALFNVPVGDECFYREIQRVTYGNNLKVCTHGFEIYGNRRVYDDFVTHPKPYKKALKDVAEIFIRNCSYYFDKPSNVALTGGFDSRTVTSVAHYCNNDFQTFTHGKSINTDVQVPMKLAGKLGFQHRLIDLSESFTGSYYHRFVVEYLKYTGGMNGFLYPHMLYGSWLLSGDSRPIITGYCGSELLRNPHFGGAVISQTVLDVLRGGTSLALQKVISSGDFKPLRLKFFDGDVAERCINKIERFFSALPENISYNQQIAVFTFEEVLPKLFGSWIYMGMHYSRMRAPFMDVKFYKEVMNTHISQVYRKFLDQNPLRRFFGQLLYAKIIDIAWPELGKQMSNKGYTPADLLSLLGRLRILYGYLGKKKRASEVDSDNLGLLSGLAGYLNENHDVLPHDLRNPGLFENFVVSEKLRDVILLNYSAYEYQRIHSSSDI